MEGVAANLLAAFKTAYYNKKIDYRINIIDYSKISVLSSLKPRQFKAATRETNGKKQVLQVFIATEGSAELERAIKVTEPIPAGHDAALMINTKIMFRDILVKGFSAPGTNLQAHWIEGEGGKASKAKLTGSVQAKITWPTMYSWNGEFILGFDFGKDNSDNATISLDGYTFQGSDQGTLDAVLDRKDHRMQFRMWGCQVQPPNYCDDCCYDNGKDKCCEGSGGGKINCCKSLHMDITSNAVYKVKVSSGNDQKIVIENPKTVPNVNIPKIWGDGVCSGQEGKAKSHIKGQLESALPDKLKAAIESITFGEASVFALQNLLFPAQNTFTLSKPYVPGDLLVLGTLTPPTSE
ncbi:hypothetical protein [Streptomyces carpaticus]|uniref:hypothetical protein n=1 Tax=Streptomyces carpaticus TaxID=285558 RepID=UPI0031F8EA9E